MKDEKGKLIPEEDFEKIAQEVPDGMKNRFKGSGRVLYKTLNNRLAKLKGLNALHYLIMTKRAMGVSDRKIAEEIGCSANTIYRHGKDIKNSELVKMVFDSLWDLVPDFKNSLKYLAAKGDAFATIKFLEGMGILNPKQEIVHKIQKEELQKRFSESFKDLLGVDVNQPVNRVAGVLSDDKEKSSE